jgi:hypothetical protein
VVCLENEDMVCWAQHKLGLALKEYRLLHSTSARGSLPMNKLIFPPALKYLTVWTLGEIALLSSWVCRAAPALTPLLWPLYVL